METIGSYQILGQLGAGGMGTVYLAEHRFLKRRSAIKVLLADLASRPDLLERFFAEARATSQIEHPGIVRIFDCEVDTQGRPYFVMELLEGDTLAVYLRSHGKLPAREAVGYARAMAEALSAAHERGIVHRDIKPDNVFVRPGPIPGIKLVDFGIAKLAGEFHATSKSRTQTGMILGTPPYMSPEQCRGAGAVDHRTDIYSLGCVLFEMLVGTPPFVRDTTGGFFVAHLTQAPPEAHEANPEISRELSALVGALLQKEPAARPSTMREVAERLSAFEAAEGRPKSPPGTQFGLGPGGGARPSAAAGRATTDAGGIGTAGTFAAGASLPPVMTTLRSTAAEVAVARVAENGAKKPRRAGLLTLAVGALAAVAAVIGVVSLRAGEATSGKSPIAAESAPHPRTAPTQDSPEPAQRAGSGAERGASAGDRPKPAAVAIGKPARAPLAAAPGGGKRAAGGEAQAPVAAAAVPAAAASAATGSYGTPQTRGFAVIDLQSSPSGAAICFEGDRRFITVTHGVLHIPLDPRPVVVLIDMPGHRPARVTVRGDRDLKRRVKLQPLPPGAEFQPACYQ